MEKTEFEIRESVLAECQHLLGEIQVVGKKPYPDYPDISCFIDDGVVSNYTVWPFGDHSSYFIIIYTDRAAVDDQWKKAYRLLGLDKRDALEAERAFWTASTDALTKSLEAEKVKNANLQQQLEEAQNVKFEGMASPAWAMMGELTKFMEETLESDTPRVTSWCARLEDGEEVTLMNIWAATSHDSPITRATELRDMLEQVLNHSNRPEMDDAQFRMFARENINHLLYGSKEGKKDE